MKKNLMLCALLLAVLLSGCAAEPLQGQTAGNTPKAPTPQEGTPASFEPVSTEPNAPTEAVVPADSMPNEDKHESDPAISSEPASAPTESNAPSSEENEQPPRDSGEAGENRMSKRGTVRSCDNRAGADSGARARI